MGRRILYELSQELSVLLEQGLQEEGRRTPVFFCHPLDAFEERQSYPEEAFGVLYLSAVAPHGQYRQSGHQVEPIVAETLRQQRRRPPLWVRARYVFLVSGGRPQDQLTVFTAAVQTLHDHPVIAPKSGVDEPALDLDVAEPSPIECPVQIVEDPKAWRSLGLNEHRLTLSFEVVCPIASSRVETVDLVQQRDVRLEESSS